VITRFDTYLENISDSVSPSILTAARSREAKALEDGLIGELGRVFNEFPLEYVVEGHQFSAVPTETKNDWLRRYETLIREGQFEMKVEDDALQIVARPEVEEKVKDLLASIIKQGCQDLLDAQGNLKPNVIRFLNLDQLIQKNKQNQAVLDQIIFQVLYSYCTQLVFASLGDPFLKSYKVPDDSAQIQQIDYLGRFCPSLCAGRDSQKKLKFTGFFTDKILDHIFENGLYSAKSCASFLRHIHPDHLSNMVRNDINTDHPDVRNIDGLQEKIKRNRGKFWLEIMAIFQAEKDILRLQMIWNSLPEAEKSLWNGSENNFHLPLPDEQLVAWRGDYAESAGDAIRYSGFYNRLQTRDNVFLIDHIAHDSVMADQSAAAYLQHAMQSMNLVSSEITAKQAAMIRELQAFKFNERLVQLPAAAFFEKIYQQSHYQDTLLLELKKYFPALAQHLESSQTDNPLTVFIRNRQWENTVFPLMNMRDINVLTQNDQDEIKHRIRSITKAFCEFVQTLTEKEQKNRLIDVVDGNNALGKLIDPTDKEARINFLKVFFPTVSQKLGLSIQDSESPIASAITHDQWDVAISILINQKNIDGISLPDKQEIYNHYTDLQKHLIKFLDNPENQFTSDQRLNLVNAVLQGRNALGKLLKQEPTTWLQTASKLLISWWSPVDSLKELQTYKHALESRAKTNVSEFKASHDKKAGK